MSPQPWSVDHLPDMTGRVVIVTGANSGLGLETTRGLAARGAHVVMACRDADKTRDAITAIRATDDCAKLEFLQLDLAHLMSVRNFAQQFSMRHQRLDILCNNAGVMALPLRRTEDGFEMQIGTNHLGHFALTGLLIDRIRETSGARVVNVSSLFHKYGKIRFDDLNWQRGYSRWPAYGQSKLANLLFTYELQRRFDRAGIDALSVASHPGYSATNLQFAGPRMENSILGKLVMRVSNALVAQPPEMGALPSLYAAGAADVDGGDFIGPDGRGEWRGYPTKVRSSRASHDEVAAGKLWRLSEELTGVSYLARSG